MLLIDFNVDLTFFFQMVADLGPSEGPSAVSSVSFFAALACTISETGWTCASRNGTGVLGEYLATALGRIVISLCFCCGFQLFFWRASYQDPLA